MKRTKDPGSLANQHLSTAVKDYSHAYAPTHTYIQTNTHYWLQMKRLKGHGLCRCVFFDTEEVEPKGADPTCNTRPLKEIESHSSPILMTASIKNVCIFTFI